MRRQSVLLMVLGCVCAIQGLAMGTLILDQSQTTVSSAYNGWPGITAWESQTITPNQQYLTSVVVGITSVTVFDATLNIYGQTTDNGISLSTLLASKTVTVPASASWAEITFPFNSVDMAGYTASAGTGRILMVIKGNSNGHYLVWGNGYAGGIDRYTTNSGGAWVNRAGDWYFKAYTDSVPEPVSFVMLGLGGLGLIRRRVF